MQFPEETQENQGKGSERRRMQKGRTHKKKGEKKCNFVRNGADKTPMHNGSGKASRLWQTTEHASVELCTPGDQGFRLSACLARIYQSSRIFATFTRSNQFFPPFWNIFHWMTFLFSIYNYSLLPLPLSSDCNLKENAQRADA